MSDPSLTLTAVSTTLWDRALDDLRIQLSEDAFHRGLEPVRFLDHNDGTLRLGVPTAFYRDWLRDHFQEAITESLTRLNDGPVHVEYIVTGETDTEPLTEGARLSTAEQREPRPSAPSSTRAAAGGATLTTVPLNRNFTFETFVVGESNRFAHAAAEAVADPASHGYNPLFLYGGVGLGKTHLMQAIGQKMLAMGRHLNIMYVSSEAFMNAFIESVARKRMPDFRKLFRSADLLLVDDVQFFAGAEQTQIEFFHTFNELFNAGKKIVLSSDHPPQQLHELEDRLRSRFECGLIVDIQPPDIETRLAIIRTKSRAMGLNLPDDVMMLIAERIRTNLRKIEGALTRLQAHWSVTRDPITTTTAKRLLGPFLPGDEPSKVTIEAVQMAVCRFFDVTLHEMTGSSRTRHCAHPRQIAAYLCRELTDASFPEIARRFGGRDHSAIHHAHKKIRGETAQNLRLQNMIKQLSRQIKNGTPPTDDADHAPEA